MSNRVKRTEFASNLWVWYGVAQNLKPERLTLYHGAQMGVLHMGGDLLFRANIRGVGSARGEPIETGHQPGSRLFFHLSVPLPGTVTLGIE